ncbi:MAG: hypothetical protein O2951_05585 [Bacteroidetes bacterium]|nr:hypothetical protein [Bacteroidota bacterium]
MLTDNFASVKRKLPTAYNNLKSREGTPDGHNMIAYYMLYTSITLSLAITFHLSVTFPFTGMSGIATRQFRECQEETPDSL